MIQVDKFLKYSSIRPILLLKLRGSLYCSVRTVELSSTVELYCWPLK